MTIKRRLFLSNILMIAIPLFLSVSVGLLILWVMFINIGQHRESEAEKKATADARSLLRSLPKDASVSDLIKDIENFNTHHSDDNVRLLLYEGREPILRIQDYSNPNSAESLINVTFSIVEHYGEYQLVITSTKNEIKTRIGKYQVVLTKTEINTYTLYLGLRSLYLAAAAGISIYIGFVAAIVFLVNRFLVRYIFNNITISLDALKYGVGQIRDGNLSYRLDTGGNNEFDAVSADFNEMAQRLLDSVNSHRQDETTRQEFIAGISHDLRTPLTSVRAYIEGIENGLDSDPDTHSRYIQTIKNRLGDLEKITDTLLLFSSVDLNEFPWRKEKIDLTVELEHMISDLKNDYLFRGLVISFIIESDKDLRVNIDTQQIRNVMINILENSVKYKIKEQGKMEIHLSRDNSFVYIKMTDDGPGVPEESLGRLFDIFYRVDSSRSETVKGNGLGLAVAAKIIHSFDGTIHAENNAAGGLSIIIKFPIVEGI